MYRSPAPLLALSLLASAPAIAATPAPAPVEAAAPSYVHLADLALAAPLVLAADIARAIPLKGEAAAAVPAGKQRYYVEATVRALISGRSALPATVSYLVDLPAAPKKGSRMVGLLIGSGDGKQLRGQPVLLLAAPTDKPGALRLIAPDAQLARTPATEQRLRAILAAAVAPDAPPAITGIVRAFHVPGSLPGESESQIFLRTADARPISLSILRRPGEQPRWAVSLSELVDASAAPPKPESLLWYRLACGLPRALPETALAELEGEAQNAVRADYAIVLAGLGPCEKAR